MRIAFAAVVGCAFWATDGHPSWAIEPVNCHFAKNGAFSSREEYRIYLLHQASDEYKYFDTQCNGHTPGQQAAYNKYLEDQIRLQLHDYDRRAGAGASTPLPKESNIGSLTDKNGNLCSKNDRWTACFVLRDSFEDISVFSSPKDVKSANGATFSWAHDAVAANTAWSAKGVAAYPISWTTDQNPEPRSAFDPYLVGLAFTPSVTFNRLTNSNPKLVKSDIDVLTFQAGAEVAVGHVFDRTTTHYFRVRGGDQADFEGTTHAWTSTAEWQPITTWQSIPNLSSPNLLGPLPATYEIDAIGRIQHLEAVRPTTLPLFATRRQISRGGPVAALSIVPQQGPDSPVPQWLQRVNFTLNYSWLRDLDTTDVYAHLKTALGFALDPTGNIAVTLSYEQGKNEDTGQKNKISKASLSAKF